tara:strand:- start:43 stop:198 length:156 start_codon:yes stop_codon:yes gene_type:complete
MLESPCKDICTTDLESGLCVGCGRSIEEIANWNSYTDIKKKEILANIESRE